MIKKASILAVSIILLCATLNPLGYLVLAQTSSQITVRDSSVQADYPNSLTFTCRAQSNSNIVDIRLKYKVEQASFVDVTSEARASFDPSTLVEASYELNMQRYGQIPPGVDIDYWWVLKDAAGNTLETAPSSYTVIDTNHQWNNLSYGDVNLFWYGQNQSFGQSIIAEMQAALATLANDTGVEPENAINILVYTNSSDYSAAILGAPDWSGGVELPQYSCILLLIRPSNFNLDISGVDHELTHVIVAQITSNPYNFVPFWLNEGLAMHTQYPHGNLPQMFTAALDSAIVKDDFISVRSLSNPFSAYADIAYLSYAESVSIITYLIDQFGAAKMGQFLETFTQGSTYDGALQANYGFDMDGLFSQWKTWVTQRYGKQPIY